MTLAVGRVKLELFLLPLSAASCFPTPVVTASSAVASDVAPGVLAAAASESEPVQAASAVAAAEPDLVPGNHAEDDNNVVVDR